MYFEIVFKKIGFTFVFGKESKHHKQIHNFSIDKIFLDENKEVYFAKQLIAF
jgi:hypothetical protein